MMARVPGFAKVILNFHGTSTSRSFGALCNLHGRIGVGNGSFIDSSIDIGCLMLRKKFDGGLYIAPLRNKATM
jgi:hypothetical protein